MAKLPLHPRIRLNTQPDAMHKKRRNGRASSRTSIEDEIAHLRGLGLAGLRARWHGVFQRQAPPHLALQLLLWEMSESMGNHDSEVVDASSVD